MCGFSLLYSLSYYYYTNRMTADVTNGKILPAPVAAVAAEAAAEFQRPAIVLTLPGGCHLTQKQYDS